MGEAGVAENETGEQSMSYFAVATEQFDTMRTTTEHKARIPKEHRSALIDAAVTGHIDVEAVA